MKHKLLTAIILLAGSLVIHAQEFNFHSKHIKNGFTLTNQDNTGINLDFSINRLTLQNFNMDGESMKEIIVDGVFLPGEEGAPNLPSFSKYIAIPEGVIPMLKITITGQEVIRDVNIAPAPRIPLDTERGNLEYWKNERIWASDKFYPEEPFVLSEKTDIRGVDAVLIGIIPFRYNPVKRELVIYHTLEIEIAFNDGSGIFGEERLRSRWFDPILQDVVLNYASLPIVDYSKRNQYAGRNENTGYEYLIIAPDDPAWLPYAGQVKDFRTKQGISTGIITLSEIGGNTVEALENYFNNAYNTWDIPPVAVLLMADYGTNAANSIISPVWNFYCVSDNIYADVNYDQLPDIIFARMTAQNPAQLQIMVSKMIDYETDPPTDPGFYNKPVTALGWQTERWFQICSEVVGGYWREMQDKSVVRINDIFEGSPSSLWSTAMNTATVVSYFGPSGRGYIPALPSQLGGWSGGTAQMIASAINDGAFTVHHRDHGFEYGWGEPGFTNSSINLLTNSQNNEFPFVFSINCLTGKFNNDQECFTEKFHRYTYNGQNAGALGLIAASEISYSFVNDVYVWGMFDNFYPDFLPDFGPYVEERGFLPAFGNAAGKYFLQQSSWPYNSGNKEVTHHLMHHHGGAFMIVFTEVPQPLTVEHDAIKYNYENTLSVIADPGAFISLTSNGVILGTAEATGEEVIITYEPLPAGSEMILTVTKQNFMRYENTIGIVAPAGPYLIGSTFEINDDLATFPNGQPDYGETISLNFNISNIGLLPANNILAVLTSDDPYITITDAHYQAGNINPDETAIISGAFNVIISGNIPDGHNTEFVMTLSNNENSWQSDFTMVANAPLIRIDEFFINDSGGNHDGFLDPGETAPVLITIKNNGHSPAFSVYGVLTTNSPYISILTTSPQVFGNLSTSQSRSAWFTIKANQSIPFGTFAGLILALNADYDVEQEDQFTLTFSDYCIPTSNCAYGDGIRSFSLAGINNLNNGCSAGGYGNFTSMTANLLPGQIYAVSLKGGYSNQKASLWIDFNSNRIFETSEMLIANFTLASSATIYVINITIPANVNSGYKRLRVRAQYQNPSSNPCANFTYGETEDYTVNIIDPDITTQQIQLTEGWNGISGFLAPQDTNLEDIFSDIIDQLIILKNREGVFWPSQSINTIGLWDPYAGFQIKMATTQLLTITGTPTEPATLLLSPGWNLIPLLSQCPLQTSEVCAPHLSKIIMIKDSTGTGIFWPDQEINTLPELLPGKSYYVFVNDVVYIEFESCP